VDAARPGGFVPLISQVPGFQACYPLKVREDEAVTISIFDVMKHLVKKGSLIL
jgi:hypothetical protein